MMKSLILLVAVAGWMAMPETASAFSTKPCQSCHAIDHDVLGPAWQRVAEKYGSAEALAAVFKSGFKVEDRRIAMSEPNFKGKASTMTLMYMTFIKGHEEDAAKALFAAVKSGQM
jgi:cytochrome c551/c552